MQRFFASSNKEIASPKVTIKDIQVLDSQLFIKRKALLGLNLSSAFRFV
jgi:hypothetical protein